MVFCYRDISLLIGSTANYAGDGPVTRTNSLEVNGFIITRINLRFYVTEINRNVLDTIFPVSSICIGDEVMKLNDIYCEHIRNVTKYLETSQIRCITLKHNRRTGIQEQPTSSTTPQIIENTHQRKRTRSGSKSHPTIY